MSENYIQHYKYWLNHLSHSEQGLVLEMDNYEVADAFSHHLLFGTAGVRAKIGLGPNRMNLYVVRRIISAYAKWLQSKGKTGILTTHDNRMFGNLFTQEVSNIMNYYGIKTYAFDSLRPSPMLSYFVRELKLDGGVNFTASHNPKDFLGVKLVNNEGSQLLPEEIEEISLFLSDEDLFNSYRFQEPLEISLDIEMRYDEMIHSIITQDISSLNVIYSPLHGSGISIVPRLFPFVHLVQEQMDPSPYFPTIDIPNPESREAYTLALQEAIKYDAELIIINDPDADRYGVMLLHNQSYEFLDGNQLGAILLQYLVQTRKPKNAVVYKTIATSSLGNLICQKHNIEVVETDIGFKWIGHEINQNTLKKNFLFAYEESHGCIINDSVRDKDGIQAVAMIMDAVAYYKARGKSLIDIYQGIVEEYGTHETETLSIPIKAIHKARIQQSIEEYVEEHYLEFLEKDSKFQSTDSSVKMLHLHFPEGRLLIRPSGTEPLIKLYFESNHSIVDMKAYKKEFMTVLTTIVAAAG